MLPAKRPAISGRGPYSLFAPLHYEPNYAYPLLVWLHGPGHDEQQLRRIMPSISLRNYVAVAPRGTIVAPNGAAAIAPGKIATVATATISDASASVDAASAAGHGWRQTEGHIQAAELRVMECLDAAAEKFHVAPDRCFLAGYGSGGTMAFRIALRNPQCFAGVLSLSGPFPSGRSPLAQLHDVRRLEVFIACCRAGSLYPTETVCHDLRLLHTAGMSVVLREYPGDDALTPQMLADMDRWLMEQVTGAREGLRAKG
ncbi:MAG TPA: alpha/beta hydrolase-fold protein [Pirellulales bacterium]|jgi:phospholipase/carboxylesterase|nr:alpha/beta hydrolase-fold protein [Pirellulales bacterium]